MSGTGEARAAKAVETARRTSAETLDLHGLGLKILPSLADLPNLRRLDLSTNRLVELPAELWELAQLEVVDLGSNRLRELDREIGQLMALRVLDLSENRLAELPVELANCTALTELDLYGNRFGEVSAVLLLLPSLEKLDLAGNRLDRLPETLKGLADLRQLDLSRNRLTELPECIGDLANLRALNLAENSIIALTPLTGLKRIEQVNVDGNKVAEIPRELFRIPSLTVLTVHDNDLDEEMRAVLEEFNSRGSRSRIALSIQDMVRGGYQPGRRYFDTPLSEPEFKIRITEPSDVLHVLGLYYKEYGRADAMLEMPDGTRLNLGRLNRKAAYRLADEHGAKLDGGSAVRLAFPATRNSSELEASLELAERCLVRVPGAELEAGKPLDSATKPHPVPAADSPPLPRTDPAAAEPVHAAVFSPPLVARDSWFLVQIYLYPTAEDAQVEQEAQRADPTADRRAKRTLPMDVPRGGRIDLHLEMRGLTVELPSETVRWTGAEEVAQFDVGVPPDITQPNSIGRVRVSVNGVPIATIRFQVLIGEADMPTPIAEAAKTWIRRHTRAFVSYASAERLEVLYRVQMLEIAGVRPFIDVAGLGPGDRWTEELRRKLDECDLFLLFWSQAASESEWVKKELAHALERQAGDEDAPPEIQPVPIEGPPLVPPPEGLEYLHFNDRYLAYIALEKLRQGMV